MGKRQKPITVDSPLNTQWSIIVDLMHGAMPDAKIAMSMHKICGMIHINTWEHYKETGWRRILEERRVNQPPCKLLLHSELARYCAEKVTETQFQTDLRTQMVLQTFKSGIKSLKLPEAVA